MIGLGGESSTVACTRRGGTDGSLLTALGLPTPNLSTGEYNSHSPLEWTSLEEMQAALDVLVHMAIL